MNEDMGWSRKELIGMAIFILIWFSICLVPILIMANATLYSILLAFVGADLWLLFGILVFYLMDKLGRRRE